MDGPSPNNPAQVEHPGDQRWTSRLVISLVAMVLVLELLTISYQMVSISLPIIATHFHTTQGAWLLTSFLLVGAVFAPIIGKLADVHGKRRMLLATVAAAALGSVISATATSYSVLIAGRALQGILTSALFLSYSLIRDVYPPRKVALSVSIATAGMGLIAIPSPWLTGWLLDTWGFRSIFWFLAICLALLGVVIAATTGESDVRLRVRIDYIGAVLLGGGLAGVLIGISFGPIWGWTSSGTIRSMVGGVALLAIWASTARVIREPLIDLRFFRQRPIVLTATSAGFAMGSVTIFSAIMPLMCMTPAILGLGYGFGVDPKGYAIFQAPIALAMVVGGLIVGFTVREIRPRPLMLAGAVLLALGPALVAVSHQSKAFVIACCVIQGLGMGMTTAAVPNLVIDAVPPELQATTSSGVSVFQSGMSAIFPVVVFTVLNSHIATVAKGAVLYRDSGIQAAFVIGALTALAAGCAALALPRRAGAAAVPSTESQAMAAL